MSLSADGSSTARGKGAERTGVYAVVLVGLSAASSGCVLAAVQVFANPGGPTIGEALRNVVFIAVFGGALTLPVGVAYVAIAIGVRVMLRRVGARLAPSVRASVPGVVAALAVLMLAWLGSALRTLVAPTFVMETATPTFEETVAQLAGYAAIVAGCGLSSGLAETIARRRGVSRGHPRRRGPSSR